MRLLGIEIKYDCYKECALKYIHTIETSCVMCNCFKPIDIIKIYEQLEVLKRAAYIEGYEIFEVRVNGGMITRVIKAPLYEDDDEWI